MLPPTFSAQVIRKMLVRAQTVTANFNLAPVTATQLAGMLAVYALTATTSGFLTSQYRLDRVRVWSWPPAAGSLTAVQLKWADSPLAASVGIANPPIAAEGTSASLDTPAYAELVPIRGSLADNWFGPAATSQMLYITCALNSTIDFEFSFVVDDIGTPPAGPAIVGAAPGTIYHKSITTGGGSITAINPLNSI
jgi:hypothetical protein